MKVRDIMTSEGLATATLDTTLTEIATRMRDENIGAVPIVDDEDRLAGIITDRDIVVRCIATGQDPEECTAEDILSEELHTIHPEADLEDAADLMASRQIRRLPVVEDEVIVGMISLGDIAVKSDEDASDALEDISEGVRETGSAEGATAARSRNASQSQQSSARGRQGASVRGRDSGELRESSSRSQSRSRTRGVSNRSVAEENKRQQKVTEMRPSARAAGKTRGKRKAG